MNRKTFFAAVCLLSLAIAGPCYGQLQAGAVQLPTFNIFTVSTTVSAPDSGGAYLGGVRRSREGSVSRGVPGLGKLPFLSRLGKNRSIGKETSHSYLSVHPTIIDTAEMDAAVLGLAAARRRELSPDEAIVIRKAGEISEHVATAAAEPSLRLSANGGAPSVAAIRRHNAMASREKNGEISRLLAKAESLEAQGKKSVAKIYFQMALRRAKGEMKQQIAQRIQALKGPAVVTN